ncbi:MAG TPA: hypothetical protein VE398_08675 [Acidobacteriota bacterium]|nr:hypothetical protein [Acidobacteriota bacterium]
MRLRCYLLIGLVAAFSAVCNASTGTTENQSKAESKKTRVELPAAVAKSVRDNVAGAEIESVESETEAGIKLYDIEFKAQRGEIEVAEDGTVMDVATIVQAKDVPIPAMDAIQKAATGATIKELEKSEIRAEIEKGGEKGKIVKLPAPKYVYEAELVKGKQKGEIQVAPDGKIVEALKWGSGEREKH